MRKALMTSVLVLSLLAIAAVVPSSTLAYRGHGSGYHGRGGYGWGYPGIYVGSGGGYPAGYVADGWGYYGYPMYYGGYYVGRGSYGRRGYHRRGSHRH